MNTIEIISDKVNQPPYYYLIDKVQYQFKGYYTRQLAMKAAKAKVLRTTINQKRKIL